MAATGLLSLTVPAGTMSARMLEPLTEAVRRADLDAGVLAVALRGAGTAFGGVLEAKEEGASGQAFIQLLCALRELPKPEIAVVHGEAVAEGVALVAIADLVLASPASRFRLKGPKAPPIGTSILARTLGEHRVAELLLTGRTMDAKQAQDLGLVTLLTPPEKLEEALAAAMAAVARQGPTLPALVKKSVHGNPDTLRDGLARDARVHALGAAAPTPPASLPSTPPRT